MALLAIYGVFTSRLYQLFMVCSPAGSISHLWCVHQQDLSAICGVFTSRIYQPFVVFSPTGSISYLWCVHQQDLSAIYGVFTSRIYQPFMVCSPAGSISHLWRVHQQDLSAICGVFTNRLYQPIMVSVQQALSAITELFTKSYLILLLPIIPLSERTKNCLSNEELMSWKRCVGAMIFGSSLLNDIMQYTKV